MDWNDSFKCLKCGDCCRWHGYVRITEKEADSIAEFLGIDVGEFIGKMAVITADRRSLSIDEMPNGDCIFFRDEPPRCEIYDVRPRQCRDFPIKWNSRSKQFRCRAELYAESAGSSTQISA